MAKHLHNGSGMCLITNVMIKFFHNLALFCVKNANFLQKYLKNHNICPCSGFASFGTDICFKSRTQIPFRLTSSCRGSWSATGSCPPAARTRRIGIRACTARLACSGVDFIKQFRPKFVEKTFVKRANYMFVYIVFMDF
jgi:hypothetical protein